jgi:GNAT superfamily N-acetyltransferase/ketosteroid isomerase-like protein
MNLRPALPADAEAASALVQASFLALGATGWDEAARAHMVRESMPEVLAAALAQPAVALLAEIDGRAAGFLLMREPARLDMLFVDPACTGRGIARRLWEAARARLEAEHPTLRTVELNATEIALPAYRRFGFAPISARFDRGGARATRMACWLPARGLQAEPNANEAVVRRFWALMASNDFPSVGAVLAPDFTLDWPQSGERIRGAANFARMNAEYPARGPWRFALTRLLAQDTTVVTEVDVSDGTQHGHAISFFTLRDGLVQRIVEYWPDPFPAPPDRAHLVERIG